MLVKADLHYAVSTPAHRGKDEATTVGAPSFHCLVVAGVGCTPEMRFATGPFHSPRGTIQAPGQANSGSGLGELLLRGQRPVGILGPSADPVSLGTGFQRCAPGAASSGDRLWCLPFRAGTE